MELENLRLFARTRDVYPSSLDIFAAAIVAKGVDLLVDTISRAIRERHERDAVLSNLFGFTRNADFVIGMRRPWDRENPWASPDVRAADETARTFSRVFSGKPVVHKKEVVEEFEPSMNVVSVGGHIPNPATRVIMGIKKPWDQSPLTYSFNLQPLGYEKEDWGKLQEISPEHPEPNWTIVKSTTKQEAYIPEYYSEVLKDYGYGSIGTIRKDYGFIIKVKSQFKEAPPGRKNVAIAGCHGFGTIAAAQALRDRDILSTIWNEFKDRDFQAIVMCNVSEDEIDSVELVEVVPVKGT